MGATRVTVTNSNPVDPDRCREGLFPVREVEFMGETVGGTILFDAADAEPLPGVTALESVGIKVDPVNRRQKRLPAVRLRGLAVWARQ